MFKSDKDVPIPKGAGRPGPALKYPCEDKEVGDSFFAEAPLKRVSNSCLPWGIRHGKSFAAR